MVLMPAVRKVSKEQIIDAAVEVLRDDGFSAINARSVAKKLGCSTQPIYFSFKNMGAQRIPHALCVQFDRTLRQRGLQFVHVLE